MREIKFKGKSPLTGWRFGQLLKLREGHYCIVQDIEKYVRNGFNYPEDVVSQETVGQFTGVLDINGKEIYEGDIVEFDILFRGKVTRTDRGRVYYHGSQFFIERGGPLSQPSDCENLRLLERD